MSLAHLAASQLGLSRFIEESPRATNAGLPIINLKNDHESYEVYVVEENDEPETVEQAARLASFYNSRFFHEYIQMNKADVKVGDYRAAFRIEDSTRNLSLFVVTRKDGWVLSELSLDHLNQVAEQLAKLHAVSAYSENLEFCQTVMENYQVIADFRADNLKSTVVEAREVIAGKFAHYFTQATRIGDELDQHLAAFLEETRGNDGHLVLCHGNLTGESLRFAENGHDMVSIVDWENVHFGDPAYDLATLIITSASPAIRRNHFMKVFRTYFYTLIDIRAQKFKLSDLKTAFRRFHREILLNGLRPLLDVLQSDLADELKRSHATRWEGVLEDTRNFLTGAYISDEEQCFFAK